MKTINKFRCFLPTIIMPITVVATVTPYLQSTRLSLNSSDVISIGVPEGLIPQFKDQVIPYIEQIVPNVTLNLVATNNISVPFNPNDINQYYQHIQTEVSSADVVFVTSNDVTPESTHSGYFLNLSPLVAVDPQLTNNEFFPQAWDAFQLDNKLWAIPSAYDTSFFVYNPKLFDQAGLSYPTGDWTIHDVIAAANKLSITQANRVITPGLFVSDPSLPILMHSLTQTDFYDNSAIIHLPYFDQNTFSPVITQWADLEKKGVISNQIGETNINQLPLQIGNAFLLKNQSSNNKGAQGELAGALLPGNSAGLDVYGFAVSKGTTQPDASYKIAKALSATTAVAHILNDIYPAYNNLQNQNTPHSNLNLSSDQQAFIQLSLKSSLSPEKLVFGNYLRKMIDIVKSGQDVQAAIQTTQQLALDNLHAADTRSSTLAFTVATPVPDAGNGKITLHFGIFTGDMSLNKSYNWGQVITQFVNSDSSVGAVKLDFLPPTEGYSSHLSAFPTQDDCFYTNEGPDQFSDQLLSLDGLLNIDSNFNRSDVVGNQLLNTDNQGHVIGFPLSLQPILLRYDVQQFQKLGLPIPSQGWNISQFADTLKSLKADFPDQPPLWVQNDVGGQYLFMLMASYGGIPIDWRTNPPTINYTSPNEIDAMRQVLDLAKNGYIGYQSLATTLFINTPPQKPVSMYVDISRLLSLPPTGKDDYALATFPTGNNLVPVSYSFVTAYISKNTAFPDACYRFIQTLAHHPELFDGMPSLFSVIDDPRTASLVGNTTVQTFKYFGNQIQNPNVFVVGNPTGSFFIASLWLKRAFDNYVLHDASLETELSIAETYTRGFLDCETKADKSTRQPGILYLDCAKIIDPTILTAFGINPAK